MNICHNDNLEVKKTTEKTTVNENGDYIYLEFSVDACNVSATSVSVYLAYT